MDLGEHGNRYFFTDLKEENLCLYNSLVLVTQSAECPCKTISYSFAKYSS